ncbi:class II fumarate hydratase [Maridesulfovibrio frigidus]|uniref:class II fumarate hydratase n=1 Tax=Maridesulfovibrio frigidus TaxID=340956 RepID=UPI0004E173F9|nr:class II fumarate hydratase [Maridesulfovibrio frigidus]
MKNGIRKESDSMGTVDVALDKYWGAQTQRSLKNFSIGSDIMPLEIVRALAMIKKAAALSNMQLGKLLPDQGKLIIHAAEEVIAGKFNDHFPLHVWQTGSGTQTNMNVNEVISNRAIEISGGEMGSKHPIHPNDHVNMSQSSNDTFPAAMHIAAALSVRDKLRPSLENMLAELQTKSELWKDVVKIGRTHLQDAVPMTLGDEFSGYAALIEDGIKRIDKIADELRELALGGTAVGTGLNAAPGFAKLAIEHISDMTGIGFRPAANYFAALSAHDVVVATSAAVRGITCSLMKIANDIRWLASGPRCGIGELVLPANEPGSSIMPGKINPTQCEAMTMVAVQVMGLDSAVAFAGSQGNFELNVFKPVMIFNLITSINLISDSVDSFTEHALTGLKPDLGRIKYYLENSLMLVTALSPEIGYDKAAEAAHQAFVDGGTLKDTCTKMGLISAERFDEIVQPMKMAKPQG